MVTLVNLNSSFSSDKSSSSNSLFTLGKLSAVVVTVLGVGLTLSWSAPVDRLTLEWALVVCADEMATLDPSEHLTEEVMLAKADDMQKNLCWDKLFACAIATSYIGLA